MNKCFKSKNLKIQPLLLMDSDLKKYKLNKPLFLIKYLVSNTLFETTDEYR